MSARPQSVVPRKIIPPHPGKRSGDGAHLPTAEHHRASEPAERDASDPPTSDRPMAVPLCVEVMVYSAALDALAVERAALGDQCAQHTALTRALHGLREALRAEEARQKSIAFASWAQQDAARSVGGAANGSVFSTGDAAAPDDTAVADTGPSFEELVGLAGLPVAADTLGVDPDLALETPVGLMTAIQQVEQAQKTAEKTLADAQSALARTLTRIDAAFAFMTSADRKDGSTSTTVETTDTHAKTARRLLASLVVPISIGMEAQLRRY